MQVEPQIGFHGMDRSPHADAKIHERLHHLERFYDHIISCQVKVDAPHHHGRHGAIYHVSVNINVPGGEVAVSNAHEINHAHEDLLVAIRDSFDAVERKLQDFVRRMDPYRIKPHPPVAHGAVARVLPDDGYGFIETTDGREFYFHRDSLTADDAWLSLQPGTKVRFTEREGDKGPFATAVSVRDC